MIDVQLYSVDLVDQPFSAPPCIATAINGKLCKCFCLSLGELHECQSAL